MEPRILAPYAAEPRKESTAPVQTLYGSMKRRREMTRKMNCYK
jgi:hypothetical protein